MRIPVGDAGGRGQVLRVIDHRQFAIGAGESGGGRVGLSCRFELYGRGGDPVAHRRFHRGEIRLRHRQEIRRLVTTGDKRQQYHGSDTLQHGRGGGFPHGLLTISPLPCVIVVYWRRGGCGKRSSFPSSQCTMRPSISLASPSPITRRGSLAER